MKKVVFKRYDQNQPMLLPPGYEQFAPRDYPVRLVNEVLERIDNGGLERTYKGGGRSSNHPRMLLKVLVYAYLRNMYSSQKIEEALKENVNFMWLTCGAKPDHKTINDFRGDRIIERSPNLQRSKQRVRKLLNSEKGIERRKQRWQVEAVFGNLKQNKGFRWFNLRRIDKTTTEFGLIALAHNLQRFSSNHLLSTSTKPKQKKRPSESLSGRPLSAITNVLMAIRPSPILFPCFS